MPEETGRMTGKTVKRKNLILPVMSLILMLCLMAGCGSRAGDAGADSGDDGTYVIYCLDRDENTLPYYAYTTETKDPAALADELIDRMSGTPEDIRYKEVIRDFDVLSVSIEDKQLILSVSEGYSRLDPTREVLTRAALVRTLCQIDGVDQVLMRIKSDDLLDSLGQPVGPMSADAFVDNAGDEINSYENIDLILYFADPAGNALTKISRSVEYNTSMSVEKLVVEQIIKGTDAEQLRSTVNPATRIINVTVKDGICYVNLDNAFLSIPDGIDPEIMIYSIVDSLAEIPGIQKVQFSIDGDTSVMLTDNLSFSVLYERNLDIVT